jgi:two-component system, OmpR family, KDP operon response regulator KdpE
MRANQQQILNAPLASISRPAWAGRAECFMPETVLVVDDDTGIGNMVVAALQDEGFATLLAHYGRQARSIARKGKPDAVVLDLSLPDAYGTELAHELDGVPIIVMSALPIGTIAADAWSVGVFAYSTSLST